MSDSSLSFAAGSPPQPATGLVLRPAFKSRPSGVVVEAFECHVRETGCPETFDRISTTRPPPTGGLVVLTEFHAQKGKRPRGDFAPCPICSPDSPQFLHGLLIWCEATSAIYAIGMDCGHTLDREGRLDNALSAYNRQEARRRLEDQLLEQLPLVPRMRRWIAAHMPVAEAADRLSHGFRRRAPLVYKVVKQAFDRNGELPVRQPEGEQPPAEPIRLVGPSFVKTSFGAEVRLKRTDELLLALDNGEDELGCIEAIGRMPEVQLVKALKFLKTAEREVAKVFELLADCADFVSPENMARLAQWSERPGAPFRLMAYAERGRVKVFMYRDKSDWGDTLDGMSTPEAPPPL